MSLITKDPPVKLFIDDMRLPNNRDIKDDLGESHWWTIVRTGEAAQWMIEGALPQTIAFDHDLGFGMTGYDVAKWLVSQDMAQPTVGYITKDFKYTCHSANPVGKKKILTLLNNYMANKYPLDNSKTSP
jgi:hypothetical protein